MSTLENGFPASVTLVSPVSLGAEYADTNALCVANRTVGDGTDETLREVEP